jgi:tRNA modification GTPase
MFSTDDTIVAIATPPGRGGIGVVRLSGPGAHAIAQQLTGRAEAFKARHATLAAIAVAGSGFSRTSAIDEVIVTCFPAPASYTGDDVVEISAHGSPVVLKAIVSAALEFGARLAEPGEFTLRAYLNGRIDLTQAEAVADLVDAVTPLQARSAFDQLQGTLTGRIRAIDVELFDLIARLEASVDFPEEGYHFVDPGALARSIDRVREQTAELLRDARRGRLVREGLQVAIVGPPNAGKSSLFNALLGASRAIVTEVPGTTRDLVSETADVEGFRMLLVDTAGLRDTREIVEAEGVARSRQAVSVSDLILFVSDGARAFSGSEFNEVVRRAPEKVLLVSNKSDLPAAWFREDAVRVSARTGDGIDALRYRMLAALDVDVQADRPEMTNVRHIALVARADEALARASGAAFAGGQSLSEEFVLADLQLARAALEEVTGQRAPEELLAHIFERFCIGK